MDHMALGVGDNDVGAAQVVKIFNVFAGCATLFMAALCNRAGHYIFALWFLSSIFYLSIFLFFLA